MSLPARPRVFRRISVAFVVLLCLCVIGATLAAPTSELPPGVSAKPLPGANYVMCAREGAFCRFEGEAHVRYGAKGHFRYMTRSDGVSCANDVFGDPAMGEGKTCAYAKKP